MWLSYNNQLHMTSDQFHVPRYQFFITREQFDKGDDKSHKTQR